MKNDKFSLCCFQFALVIYRIIGILTLPLTMLYYSYKFKTTEYLLQKIGSGEIAKKYKSYKSVWVHAASVGETKSTKKLIKMIINDGFDVILTNSTITGHNVSTSMFDKNVICLFSPFDVDICLNNFLKNYQPIACILIESEIWPLKIYKLWRRKIPCILINAKITKRTFKRWLIFQGIAKHIFSKITYILAQNKKIKQRMLKLGAKNIKVTGNIKYSNYPDAPDHRLQKYLRNVFNNRPVFLNISTHKNEEKIIIEAHKKAKVKIPELVTIILPRHPQRAQQIKKLAISLIGSYDTVCLNSEDHSPHQQTEIYIRDTLGETSSFLQLYEFCFIGGSLIELGGHDPTEVIKSNCIALYGPSIYNFNDVYNIIQKSSLGYCCHTSTHLAKLIFTLCNDNSNNINQREKFEMAITKIDNIANNTYHIVRDILKKQSLGPS